MPRPAAAHSYDIAVIDAQSCGRCEVGGRSIRPMEAPGLKGCAIAQECVVRRFTRGCRPSGAVEISGRRHEDAAVFGELAHDCGAVGGRTDPDRNIQTLADEIDQPVVEFQRDGETIGALTRRAPAGSSRRPASRPSAASIASSA
jgi:hypothetical protein